MFNFDKFLNFILWCVLFLNTNSEIYSNSYVKWWYDKVKKMKQKIAIGSSNFEAFIERDALLVDKTLLIRDLLDDGNDVMLHASKTLLLVLKLNGPRPVGSSVTSYACLMFWTTWLTRAKHKERSATSTRQVMWFYVLYKGLC